METVLSGLLLISFLAGSNCGFSDELAIDESRRVESAGTVAERDDASTDTETAIPAQLIPIVRFQGNVDLLEQISDRTDLVLGNQDWRNEQLPMSLLQELNLDEIRKGLIGQQITFMYEFFIVVPLDGRSDTSFAVLLTAPLTRSAIETILDDQLQGLQTDAEGFASTDDLRLLVTDSAVALLFTEGSYVLPEPQQLLQDAVARLQRDPPHRAFEVVFEPRQIRASVRQPWLSTVLATLNADIQKRDDEDSLNFRLREVYGKVVAQLLDLSFNQTEMFSCALNFDSESKQLSWSFQLDAVPNSHVDHWINRQHKIQNFAIEALHPDHSLFFSLAIALPEVLQHCLPELGGALAGALQREGLLTSNSARQLRTAIGNMASADSLQLLVQGIPDVEQQLTLLATLPLPVAIDLTSTAIELVSSARESGWLIADTEIDGWPVHLYPNALGIFFPRIGHDFQFVATDRQVAMQLTSEESRTRLQEVVRHEYDPPDHAQRFRYSGLSAQVRLCEFLKSQSVGEDVIRSLFGERGLQEMELSDRVTVRTETRSHRVLVAVSFEEDAYAGGVIGFCSLLMATIETISPLF